MSEAPSRQRELVLHLLALQAKQEQALVSGDMTTLTSLSETRLRLVQESRNLLPPLVDWTPDVQRLADELKLRTADLEHALRTRRDAVTHQLAGLIENQRASAYFAPVVRGKAKGWTA